MILKKMTMKNFRQFYGVQSIDFAPGNVKSGHNVTVVFGENGRGKTAIFRAIMFCLFGDRKLSQDGDIAEKEIVLVNTSALKKKGADGNTTVESSVELEFSHRGNVYSLKRVILGMIDGDDTIEQLDEVRLCIRQMDGNTKIITDLSEIDILMNSILDRRVKEYFLFDGEKIERLTRASNEQRREISKGIRNLLNVDALEKARDATKRLCRKLDRELANNSTGEMAQVIKMIHDNEEGVSKIEEQIENIDTEIEYAQTEKQKVDKELDAYNEIKELVEERKRLEFDEHEKENILGTLLASMKTKIGKISLLLMTPTVDAVYKAIDQKKKRGEIPSQIKKELIERIIQDGTCICGGEVRPDTEALKRIIAWKDRTFDDELQDVVLDVWRSLSSVISQREDLEENLETSLQKYGVTKNELERIRARIQKISDDLRSQERQDAANLEEHRKIVEDKIVKLTAKRQVADSDLKQLQDEHEKLISQRKDLERQEGILNELQLRTKLAIECHDALNEVYYDFTQEIKERIGKNATDLFQLLLSEQGHKNLCKIVVNNDYSLQVYDRWNNPFLANISAGQRQVMSISFIAALAKAAAADRILEMPLFMDTPFGRLSYDHRKNLIDHLPNFCAQWILLATDTEFRKQEASLLENGKKWGKFYILKALEDGSTLIKEQNIAEAQAILKSVLEVEKS